MSQVFIVKKDLSFVPDAGALKVASATGASLNLKKIFPSYPMPVLLRLHLLLVQALTRLQR